MTPRTLLVMLQSEYEMASPVNPTNRIKAQGSSGACQAPVRALPSYVMAGSIVRAEGLYQGLYDLSVL